MHFLHLLHLCPPPQGSHYTHLQCSFRDSTLFFYCNEIVKNYTPNGVLWHSTHFLEVFFILKMSVSLHMHICNFTYAHKDSTAFYIDFHETCKWSTALHADTYLTYFHQNQTINVESMERNSFKPLRYGFHNNNFHVILDHSINFCRHCLYCILSKLEWNCRKCGQKFVYALGYDTTFTALIFTKLTIAQWH